MAITRIIQPKVRKSLQGDWWVLDGIVPKYKLESAADAVLVAETLYQMRVTGNA